MEDQDLLRLKFNDIMEETLVRRKDSFIMSIHDAFGSELFDCAGYLTNAGKIQFWREVDRQLELFDHQEIDLTPTPVVSESRQSKSKRRSTSNNIHKPRRKLPTPPPRDIPRDRSSSSSPSWSRLAQWTNDDRDDYSSPDAYYTSNYYY